MHNLVIADTSCLIVLKKIDELELLKQLFETITITKEISIEFRDQLPNWIIIAPITNRNSLYVLQLELDIGEASAITLGMENPKSLLLIDEKKGRKKAKELGLNILGTLGVLIKAKERGLISSLTEIITKLSDAGFRMSNKLIQDIISKHD